MRNKILMIRGICLEIPKSLKFLYEVFYFYKINKKLIKIINLEFLRIKINIILKVDNICSLSPSAISDLNLLYVQKNPFTILEEFKIWKKKLFEKNSYFERFRTILNKLFVEIYLPCLEFFEAIAKEQQVRY